MLCHHHAHYYSVSQASITYIALFISYIKINGLVKIKMYQKLLGRTIQYLLKRFHHKIKSFKNSLCKPLIE